MIILYYDYIIILYCIATKLQKKKKKKKIQTGNFHFVNQHEISAIGFKNYGKSTF